MLTILQVAEQLLPHIAAGEIPFEEFIVVQVQSEVPGDAGTRAIDITRLQ